jgi:glycosyltransferase involved in cell wall biosynthesis
MPFFSVLMPTRNRASLLKSALQTAIEQKYQDYEIIVSDNNSTDNTREVVQQFASTTGKIKYVNPGCDLSMCDNWEYVLSHATGQYVLYLCDDDALTPDSLSYIHDLLQQFAMKILVWRAAAYNHPDIPDADRQTFSYNHSSGSLFEVESSPMLAALCRFDWSVNGVVPKMLNCVVVREAIETCRRQTEIFFVPPFPDFASVGQLLSTNSSYHFIDLPLYISGASRVSNAGILFDRKKKHDEYVSLFGRDLLAGVPYQMRYLINSYFYATWLLFQRIYPEAFTCGIDTGSYLKSSFSELVRFEGYDDIVEEFDQLAAHMRDFTGSDTMFQELWTEHQLSKQNGSKPSVSGGSLGRLKDRTWAVMQKNERLFSFLARVRGHKINSSTHRNVESIQAAAVILARYLATAARPAKDLKPIRVASTDFLAEQRS